MLFSVVIPVYNVESYLDECLTSIIEQVVNLKAESEILLIDDGSTDSSGKICDYYYSLYPNIIKVFHNVNQGLLLTRRFGYKHATGEYIINCDSDDVLEMDALETLKRIIMSYNRPDMIIFNHYLYDGKNKRVAYENIISNKLESIVEKQEVLKHFMLGDSLVSICGAVYKRSCVDTDMDYSKYAYISNGEDSLQKIELFDKSETYIYLNKALYDYRMGSGMTGKFDPNYFYSFKTVIEKIEEREKLWNLDGFSQLLSIKVLTTAGRAITQSRYNIWKNIREHKKYLSDIREDKLFKKSILKVISTKRYLQKDHLILLIILNFKLYGIIVILLMLKNQKEKISSFRKG